MPIVIISSTVSAASTILRMMLVPAASADALQLLSTAVLDSKLQKLKWEESSKTPLNRARPIGE